MLLGVKSVWDGLAASTLLWSELSLQRGCRSEGTCPLGCGWLSFHMLAQGWSPGWADWHRLALHPSMSHAGQATHGLEAPFWGCNTWAFLQMFFFCTLTLLKAQKVRKCSQNPSYIKQGMQRGRERTEEIAGGRWAMTIKGAKSGVLKRILSSVLKGDFLWDLPNECVSELGSELCTEAHSGQKVKGHALADSHIHPERESDPFCNTQPQLGSSCAAHDSPLHLTWEQRAGRNSWDNILNISYFILQFLIKHSIKK